MNLPRRVPLPMKLLLIAVVAALLICGVRYGVTTVKERRIDKEALGLEALADAATWRSYGYNLEATLLLKNYKTAKTALKGVVDGDGDYRIIGKLLDTEVEICRVGDDHYHYDATIKKWRRLADRPPSDNVLLNSLIFPAVHFAGEDIVALRCIGRLKDEGETCFRYTVIPREGDHIADIFLRDIEYKIDVSLSDRRIVAATITAKARTAAETPLKIRVRFFDVNAVKAVTAPTTATP